MIALRMLPSRAGQGRRDRGPLILACDGCGKRATPSAAIVRGWSHVLGARGGRPAVLDLCPGCAAALRAGLGAV